MIDGINENEWRVLTDIGDMIIEQSSRGNSTKVLLTSEKLKNIWLISNYTLLVCESDNWMTISSVLLWTPNACMVQFKA